MIKVSVSCILPVVNGMKNNFLKMVSSDSALPKSLKNTAKADLRRIALTYHGADPITALAACMDHVTRAWNPSRNPCALLSMSTPEVLSMKLKRETAQTWKARGSHLLRNLQCPFCWKKITLTSSSLSVMSLPATSKSLLYTQPAILCNGGYGMKKDIQRMLLLQGDLCVCPLHPFLLREFHRQRETLSQRTDAVLLSENANCLVFLITFNYMKIKHYSMLITLFHIHAFTL